MSKTKNTQHLVEVRPVAPGDSDRSLREAVRFNTLFHSALRTPVRQRILLFVMLAGPSGLRLKDIASGIDRESDLVHHHLASLQQGLLVQRSMLQGERVGARRYAATELADRWVAFEGLRDLTSALSDYGSWVETTHTSCECAICGRSALHASLAASMRSAILYLLARARSTGKRTTELCNLLGQASDARVCWHLRDLLRQNLIQTEIRKTSAGIESWHFLASEGEHWMRFDDPNYNPWTRTDQRLLPAP